MSVRNNKRDLILGYLKEHPDASVKETAEATNSCSSTVTKYFHEVGVYRRKEAIHLRTYNPGDEVGENGCILIKRTFITKNKKWKGLFKCSCGQEFEAIIADVASGRCKSCGCKKQHKIGEKLGDNEHTLIKRLYKGDGLSKTWICEFECGLCGKHFTARITDIVDNSKTCCGCQTMSKGENRILKILSRNNITFDKEKSFDGCINPVTNAKLKFDFYLPDYNICIEYDGEQHFKEVPFCPDTLEERQERDRIKDIFCKNNNIKLIRIPYTDFKQINDKFLLDKISSCQ